MDAKEATIAPAVQLQWAGLVLQLLIWILEDLLRFVVGVVLAPLLDVEGAVYVSWRWGLLG